MSEEIHWWEPRILTKVGNSFMVAIPRHFFYHLGWEEGRQQVWIGLDQENKRLVINLTGRKIPE